MPYVGGEGLSPNNFIIEDQSISKSVPETQSNGRKGLENVIVIVHDDFSGTRIGDLIVGNVEPCNMSFPPSNTIYICLESCYLHAVVLHIRTTCM